MPTTSLRNWNFQSYHVETDIEGGEFINAQSILIAAGPPKLRYLGGTANTAAKALSGIGNVLGANSNAQKIAAGVTAAAGALDNQDQNIEDLSPIVYPIGVVEAINVSQAKQIQRLFEIGSKRSYFVPGRNIGQASITRTVFNGPNLLRALYAYYPANKINVPRVRELLHQPRLKAVRSAVWPPTVQENDLQQSLRRRLSGIGVHQQPPDVHLCDVDPSG
jgi:hypothetical protein